MKIVFLLATLLLAVSAKQGEFFYRLRLKIEASNGMPKKEDLEVEPTDDMSLGSEEKKDTFSEVAKESTIPKLYSTAIYNEPMSALPRTLVAKTERQLYGEFNPIVNYDFKPSTGVDWIVSPPPLNMGSEAQESYILEFRSSMPSCLFSIDSATLHDTEDIYIKNLVRCDSGQIRISPVPEHKIKSGLESGEASAYSDTAKVSQFLY